MLFVWWNLLLKKIHDMSDRLICICNGVTEKELQTAILKKGATTMDDLKSLTYVSTGCGRCSSRAMEVLDRELRNKEVDPQQKLGF
ncbi:(2Fe-2S)-binding protein [Puteibacter caeruleilacunae]|nr:(2Fe-2S)-binding protein [Puteibacter caeruleilacunae]